MSTTCQRGKHTAFVLLSLLAEASLASTVHEMSRTQARVTVGSGGLSAGVGSAISLLEGDVMDNYVVSIASLKLQTDVFTATLSITQGCGSNATTLFSKDVNRETSVVVEVTGVPFDRAAWERGDDLCVKLTGDAQLVNFFSMFVGLTFVPKNGVPELLTPALSPDAVTQHIAAGSYDGVDTTWGMSGELSSSAQISAGIITCTESGKVTFSLKSYKPGFLTIHDHTGAETAFSFSASNNNAYVSWDVPCVKGKQIFVVSEQASHFSWAFDATPTAVPTAMSTLPPPTQTPVTSMPARVTSAPQTVAPPTPTPATAAPATETPPTTLAASVARPVHEMHRTLARVTVGSGTLSAGVGSAISLLEGDVMDNYVVSITSLTIWAKEDADVTLSITQGCGSNTPTLFSKDVNMGAWRLMTVEVTGVPFDRAAWERGDDLCVKLTGTSALLEFFSMSVGLTFVPKNGVPELLTPALSPDAVTQHIAAGSYDGVNTTWGMNGELSSSAQTYAGVITCTEYGKLRFSLKDNEPGFVTIHDHTGTQAFSFSASNNNGVVWMDVPCVKGKQIFVVSEQASYFSWNAFFYEMHMTQARVTVGSGGLSAGVGSAISLLEGDVMDNYVVSIASLRLQTKADPLFATLSITQGCGSNAAVLFSKDVTMGAWRLKTVEVTGVLFDRAAWERGDDLCLKLTGTSALLEFFSMSVGLTFVPNNGVPELLTPALSPDAVTQHIAAGSYDGVNTTWGMNGELSSSAQTYAGVITCTEYGKLRFSLKANEPGFVTIHDHTGAETAFSFSANKNNGIVWMDVPCVKGKQIFVVSEQASHFSWAFFDVTPTAVPPTAVPTVAPTFVPPTAVPTAVPTVWPTLAPLTAVPTAVPTVAPPTAVPTVVPTVSPTVAPPTPGPTVSPTVAPPTAVPTAVPTVSPTAAPTVAPPTAVPTAVPTVWPTLAPLTAVPTAVPTVAPTVAPPTAVPTVVPTVSPTVAPPTPGPTVSPTVAPPTAVPTAVPTVSPTAAPTVAPPTAVPTAVPTVSPTVAPPTPWPTVSPTVAPPTASPPTALPTALPTVETTLSPVAVAVAVTQIVKARVRTHDPGSVFELAQGFLSVPGQLLSFDALTLSRAAGDSESAIFWVTVIGDTGSVLQWVTLGPGQTATITAEETLDGKTFTVLFQAQKEGGNEFNCTMLLHTKFTPMPEVPVLDVARLRLNRNEFGFLPLLPMSGESHNHDMTSEMQMLDCGAVDSEMTFTVSPFRGSLRVLASNTTSFMFQDPGVVTVFTTTCLRGSAIWVSATADAVFGWGGPTHVPSTSVDPSAVPPFIVTTSPPLVNGTEFLSAVVEGFIDFRVHSMVNTVSLDLMSPFKLTKVDLSDSHTAYMLSFVLTRGPTEGETVEFVLVLHSANSDAVLWSTEVTLGPNETFVGTPSTVYAEKMYFRASPMSAQTGRMSFAFTMRVQSVFVPHDVPGGSEVDVLPTLSVAKAVNATGASLQTSGAHSSAVKDFSGTLLCEDDADVTVTATLGSVSAVGADLTLHVASNMEGVLVVRCVKGSAVVASCVAPCGLQWAAQAPVPAVQDKGTGSGIPTYVWMLAGSGALLVVVLAGVLFARRRRSVVAYNGQQHCEQDASALVEGCDAYDYVEEEMTFGSEGTGSGIPTYVWMLAGSGALLVVVLAGVLFAGRRRSVVEYNGQQHCVQDASALVEGCDAYDYVEEEMT